jgi:hypothetical protein
LLQDLFLEGLPEPLDDPVGLRPPPTSGTVASDEIVEDEEALPRTGLGYLQKPFSRNDLLRTVREVLDA